MKSVASRDGMSADDLAVTSYTIFQVSPAQQVLQIHDKHLFGLQSRAKFRTSARARNVKQALRVVEIMFLDDKSVKLLWWNQIKI